MNGQNPNRRQAQHQSNAARYDMYAAFRTKERAALEKRKRSGEQSIYDNYRTRSAEARLQKAQNAESQQRRGARRQNPNTVHPDTPRTQSTPAQNRTQERDARPGTYGTRVQSEAGSAYRYGFHSSYRTSDGRILDGFDKTGKPIYRDPYASRDGGESGVIIHNGAAVAMGEHRLRPVRRARIITLDNTERKPFPLKLIFSVLVCTALVMLVLYTYMELNEQTNKLSALSYQLSSLRSQANTLQAEVVRRENLLSIEQTAADVLGMVKTDVLTKKYVSIKSEDKTEVIVNSGEVAAERVSVEIDLATGRPIEKDDSATSYTPSDTTETSGTSS